MPDLISVIPPAVDPSRTTAELGRFGESLAARYLEARGIAPVVANFKVPIGRNRKGVQVTGEIDLIAIDRGVLCFIEVKTRTSDDFAAPETAVNLRKQRQIVRTARIYRRIFGLGEMPFRYDVISIVTGDSGRPRIEHLKGYFTEACLERKHWRDDY